MEDSTTEEEEEVECVTPTEDQLNKMDIEEKLQELNDTLDLLADAFPTPKPHFEKLVTHRDTIIKKEEEEVDGEAADGSSDATQGQGQGDGIEKPDDKDDEKEDDETDDIIEEPSPPSPAPRKLSRPRPIMVEIGVQTNESTEIEITPKTSASVSDGRGVRSHKGSLKNSSSAESGGSKNSSKSLKSKLSHKSKKPDAESDEKNKKLSVDVVQSSKSLGELLAKKNKEKEEKKKEEKNDKEIIEPKSYLKLKTIIDKQEVLKTCIKLPPTVKTFTPKMEHKATTTRTIPYGPEHSLLECNPIEEAPLRPPHSRPGVSFHRTYEQLYEEDKVVNLCVYPDLPSDMCLLRAMAREREDF